MMKYLTSKEVVSDGCYIKTFVDDIIYYEMKKQPVRVEDHAGYIRIHPTLDDMFPSGQEYWTHDNSDANIIAKTEPIKIQLDEDLFKL